MSQERHRTAEALLDVAEDLFSARGYAAVGIREIVEQAGVNIAAINYHFGSKQELYLAAVRRAMERRRTVAAWNVLDPVTNDPTTAAVSFVRFIRGFLHGLLPVRETDAACRLMLREAIQPTGAIEAVVRDFIEPNERVLMDVLAVLAPEASDDERSLLAGSVLGQIVHYRVFLPFLERLSIGSLEDPTRIDVIADHIARFSLRGLGWSPTCIEQVLERSRSCAASFDVIEN